MKTPAMVWVRLLRRFLHTCRFAWQTHWTEERKAEVTFLVGSFLLSGLLFWFALRSLE
jgi:hypothetical protein